MNDFDTRYVTKLLNIHDEMGLSSEDDHETRIWHMLRSLIEYCDGQEPRLDLDLILENVREDFRENGASPAQQQCYRE